MWTIAVLNQKGGVGKSTLSTNLAAAAHVAGKRTLILDLDRQGSAFDWYNARAEGSRLEGLNVARADRALSLPKFRQLSDGYDIIICDGPPRLGEITRAAAVAADVVLIPLRPGGFDWWAASETLTTLDDADATRAELGRPTVRRVFVLNGAAPNTKIAQQALDALGGVGELAPVVIHNRVAFADVALSGESVITTQPEGPAAKEIIRLFAALTKEPTRAETRSSK
jgi:chromosome partitioning protein